MPKIGEIYEFINYDGTPATLCIVDITDLHVWYKWNEENAPHVYPMTLELWNIEEYKLIPAGMYYTPKGLLPVDIGTGTGNFLGIAVDTLNKDEFQNPPFGVKG